MPSTAAGAAIGMVLIAGSGSVGRGALRAKEGGDECAQEAENPESRGTYAGHQPQLNTFSQLLPSYSLPDGEILI